MSYCSKCGQSISDNDKFCPSCGQKIKTDSVTDNMSSDLKSMTTAGDENSSPKSRIIALVLAWFFGWCGAEQFYLGKIASGIVMVIFFWTGIPAIVSFIQFIIILCGGAVDSNGKPVKNW